MKKGTKSPYFSRYLRKKKKDTSDSAAPPGEEATNDLQMSFGEAIRKIANAGKKKKDSS